MVKKAFILVADGSEEIEFVTVYDGMTGPPGGFSSSLCCVFLFSCSVVPIRYGSG